MAVRLVDSRLASQFLLPIHCCVRPIVQQNSAKLLLLLLCYLHAYIVLWYRHAVLHSHVHCIHPPTHTHINTVCTHPHPLTHTAHIHCAHTHTHIHIHTHSHTHCMPTPTPTHTYTVCTHPHPHPHCMHTHSHILHAHIFPLSCFSFQSGSMTGCMFLSSLWDDAYKITLVSICQ